MLYSIETHIGSSAIGLEENIVYIITLLASQLVSRVTALRDLRTRDLA